MYTLMDRRARNRWYLGAQRYESTPSRDNGEVRPQQTEAIVLHSTPSRERDKLVVFVSPERGKLRGWAYGARSLRTRYGASLEPLSRVRVHYVEKEADDTVRIESVELIRSLFPAQQRLDASVTATWLAELTDTFVQPDEPAERMFRLLDASCQALVDGAASEPVALYFELWVLRLAGVFPSLEDCIDCENPLTGALRFDAARGGFVCGQCGGRGEIIANDVRAVIQRVQREKISTFAADPPGRAVSHELRTLVRDVRRHFLGQELRSWEILQGVLASTRA